jgi:hypothetical protein
VRFITCPATGHAATDRDSQGASRRSDIIIVSCSCSGLGLLSALTAYDVVDPDQFDTVPCGAGPGRIASRSFTATISLLWCAMTGVSASNLMTPQVIRLHKLLLETIEQKYYAGIVRL